MLIKLKGTVRVILFFCIMCHKKHFLTVEGIIKASMEGKPLTKQTDRICIIQVDYCCSGLQDFCPSIIARHCGTLVHVFQRGIVGGSFPPVSKYGIVSLDQLPSLNWGQMMDQKHSQGQEINSTLRKKCMKDMDCQNPFQALIQTNVFIALKIN